MTMGPDSLKMLDREMEWVIEPGDFTIQMVTTTVSASPPGLRGVGGV